MKHIFFLATFLISTTLTADVFLECSPYKEPKGEQTKDLLFIMTRDGFSKTFEKEMKEGVYLFNNADGKIYDKTYRIDSTHISYKSNIFDIVGVYKSQKRVLVDRKTLKAKMKFRNNLTNRTNTSNNDYGSCRILTAEEYSREVEIIMDQKEEGNQF